MISDNRFIFLAALKEQATKMPLLFSRSAPIILSDGIAYNVSTERSDRDKAAPKPSSTPGQYGPVRPKSHKLSKARSLSSDFVDKAIEVASVIELSEASGRVAAGLFMTEG